MDPNIPVAETPDVEGSPTPTSAKDYDVHSLALSENSETSVKETPTAVEDHPTEAQPDPDILESLIKQLRASLAQAEEERDDLKVTNTTLATSLEATQSALSDLEKQHIYISAAKEAVESELKEEKRKREEADESVELLRGKADDARKALGALQNQDKRAVSMAGLGVTGGNFVDLSDDAVPAASVALGAGADRRSKRASMMITSPPSSFAPTPTIKHSHRRLSSQSEPGSESFSFAAGNISGTSSSNHPSIVPSPAPTRKMTGGLRELRLGTGSSSIAPPSPPAASTTAFLDPAGDTSKDSSRRWSALSVLRGTPSIAPSEQDDIEELDDSPNKKPRPAAGGYRSSFGGRSEASYGEVGQSALDDMLLELKAEISQLKNQLAESQEARLASDNCLKALREFMASPEQDGGSTNGELVGSPMHGLRLPPLPTDMDDDDDEYAASSKPAAPARTSGWWSKLSAGSPAAEKTEPTASSYNRLAPSPIPASPPVLPEKSLPTAPSAPLANFVSSWSKGVTGGSPSSAQVITTPSLSPPAIQSKVFSFFGKSAVSTPKAPETEPDTPAVSGGVAVEDGDPTDSQTQAVEPRLKEIPVEHTASDAGGNIVAPAADDTPK